MKKIIPLIFSVLYVLTSNAQAVGGWGNCEFATVATMNAFDPSTNAYDCKKVFVQATDEHYYWNGTIWVLDADTDDQNASEVPFTPVGTIVATDVQAAITEIEPDIYGSIDVHSDVDVTTITPTSGNVLSWDGSNFVPSSTYNIYNTDGSLTGIREVTLGNFDIEFNSTGTGDFFVSDNGTIVFAVEDDHVGIGIDSPTNPLHIFETTGTAASATNGSIFLEKGNSGGSQSIVFESNVAAGSDYAYIEYSDDGSGNGSTAENSLLVIGIGDDGIGVNQDDIAIMPSGNLGVGTTTPAARFDVDGGTVKFSDYGTGANTGTTTYILAVDADGDVIEVDPSTIGGGDNLGNHVAEENIQMTDLWISNDGDDEGIFVTGIGNVGIGTDTPDALLDVEGGTVRFSDYGIGTYADTTAVYLLGVEADGDLIEMNTAKSSRVFYPPAMSVIANAVTTNLTIDLHQTYLDLFQSPAISSTSAPGAIPSYAQDELYYYITDYDMDVFENITIDANGLMEYDVKQVATDNFSYVNVVFVVKEP